MEVFAILVPLLMLGVLLALGRYEEGMLTSAAARDRLRKLAEEHRDRTEPPQA